MHVYIYIYTHICMHIYIYMCRFVANICGRDYHRPFCADAGLRNACLTHVVTCVTTHGMQRNLSEGTLKVLGGCLSMTCWLLSPAPECEIPTPRST